MAFKVHAIDRVKLFIVKLQLCVLFTFLGWSLETWGISQVFYHDDVYFYHLEIKLALYNIAIVICFANYVSRENIIAAWIRQQGSHPFKFMQQQHFN